MTLALIAGRGDLPAAVADALAVPPLVCGYEGVQMSGLVPDLTFRLETLGTLLSELGASGITDVCFVGGLERPVLDPAKLDAKTVPLVPLFIEALKEGDDGALRVVISLFEKAGFQIVAAHEIAPDLLARGGVYSAALPDAQMRSDAGVAAAHILALSAQDIGQACVAAGGTVVGMEDARGTDAMLARVGTAENGILFKAPKAGQSRLVDLPTVGPDTVEAVHKAGLRGLVVDAGGVLVLHSARCVQRADALGLVFWARTGA